MSTKFCPQCGVEHPLEDFPVNNARPDGRGGWCRVAMRKATKRWKTNNPEVKKLHARIYYANKQLAKHG